MFGDLVDTFGMNLSAGGDHAVARGVDDGDGEIVPDFYEVERGLAEVIGEFEREL